ncbi:MobA/MobL family protein [Luteibacter aegosomatissinici]|uniref:MobA/MobL family protein n=1 Tax=Luteibacter aegosomatissinici TaxID=2911539 RepID=UPI001FF76742|nr:MobA/MobL family protein [Luteibacter aegosomatissinici]UPG92843.1 MobA/MobL family protein [Luteibacter aegosomatissinici]
MAEHARPHLHTHNRDRKHSAVAAAAYRLGIKLFDEQTKTWHDYSKRAGKAVVFGETIGPHGAPGWLLDPATLWNEVEKAEKRVDAQICRDYRIPIPLGLGQDAAIAMSRAMAGYILARFNTPVCIAVHHDNAVDLDGNAKPPGSIGFHAHLLFPTRELVRDGDGGGEGWRLTRKLDELGNRRMSAPIVDAMNEKWARLANRFLAEAGLPATYEYKSYKRLGIDRKPGPVRARKYGDQAKWYKNAVRPNPEAIVLTHGLRRLKKQVTHAAGPEGAAPPIDLKAASVVGRLNARRAARGVRDATVKVRRLERRARAGQHGKAPLANRVNFVAGRTLRIDHHLRLAEAMRRAGAPPKTDAEHAALERSMFLADLLESVLFAMERARQERADFHMRMMREKMALDDARARQDVVDGELRKAEAALQRWLISHPLRARYHPVSGEHRTLSGARDRALAHVQRVQASKTTLRQNVSDLQKEIEARARREEASLARMVALMAGYKPEFRTVTDALRNLLGDQQNQDVEQLAARLDVDMPDMMPLSRAESAFKGKHP